ATVTATTGRSLFPTGELRAVVDPAAKVGEPMTRGHFPLDPAVVDDADAVIFITDTDGKQHQYW
ncbi:erythromycin esterase family protein, partial [Kibdelosporangium lantanae]